MYAMFELEKHFNMKIEKTGESHVPGVCLTVDFKDSLYDYMKKWLNEYELMQKELENASSDEEREEIRLSYQNWKWTFPQGIVDETKKGLQKARINTIQPWESLWGSSATTPLVDFHHRLTACPSYQE